MSKTIWAAKNDEPIFPFNAHEPDRLADDADAREARGEDPFIPNEAHIPDSGMNIAEGNFFGVFEILGITVREDKRYPVREVIDACSRALFEKAPDQSSDWKYVSTRVGQILRIAVKGEALGATHIIAA